MLDKDQTDGMTKQKSNYAVTRSINSDVKGMRKIIKCKKRMKTNR
jgi:hypothetical protein